MALLPCGVRQAACNAKAKARGRGRVFIYSFHSWGRGNGARAASQRKSWATAHASRRSDEMMPRTRTSECGNFARERKHARRGRHVTMTQSEESEPSRLAVPVSSKEKQLSTFDRLLSLWILLACGLGMSLSQIAGVRSTLAKTSVGTTNIPIAIGLILMMYPPLAKVRYDRIPKVIVQVRPMLLSIVQNWIIGPLLMFSLAFAFLKDSPAYLQGVILVGCARCIAMVVVWNEFASGDSELCATLVALNSVLTVVLYAPFAYALINKLLPALGVLPTMEVSFGFSSVLQSVAIYLGIPFVLGLLSWLILRAIKGEEWYYGKFAKWISPITLAALLFTIVILFASEGYFIMQRPMEIVLCAAPMLIYFIVMFVSSFFMAYFLSCSYAQCATIAFTAASNNFELALAVAVSLFGSGSPAAFATILGPLVEIPVMLILVHVSNLFAKLCFKSGPWSWTRKQIKSQVPESPHLSSISVGDK